MVANSDGIVLGLPADFVLAYHPVDTKNTRYYGITKEQENTGFIISASDTAIQVLRECGCNV